MEGQVAWRVDLRLNEENHVPVVKWISRQASNLLLGVRIPPGTPVTEYSHLWLCGRDLNAGACARQQARTARRCPVPM